MNKLKKRILSLITAAAVAFSAVALPDTGILSGLAVTASAETNTQILKYLATDGILTTLNENATTVKNFTTSWSSGWYVVSTDVTIADRISVSGTVNLILGNNATLTASKGITVGSDATLNIYAQTNDEATMGALVADATNDNANWYAGIGGVENADAGMITINGGQINATGWCAAGIGSGGGTSTVGTITINGGIVTAQDNAHYGAGIGGGMSGGKASTINLNGGVIHAAGIGSGWSGGDCSITVNISDGVKKIVSTPVQGGACIGKGASASGSVTVNFISGGNIVTGDAKDAVFYDTGEGAQRQVRAKAMNHAVTMSDDLKANITATSEYAFTGETVTLTLGTAVDATTLSVNDGAVATTDAGNRQYTFTMPDGDVTVTATLLQTYAVSLPANMEVVSATNAADADGKYITGTTVTFKASFPYAASNVSDGTSTLEPDANGIYTVTVADADVTITATVERSTTIDLSDANGDFNAIEGDVLTGSTSHTVTIANNAKITLSDVTITGGIVCEGSATITLVGENDVKATSLANDLIYQTPGIKIGGTGTTLTIKGDGSLNATGGIQAAGIGLGRTYDNNATGGSVVIESGTVTASGGNGIGTGTVGNSKTATVGDIIIKGGTVNASLGKGYIYNGCTATVGYIKIYDTIDMVDASKITESVTYMHVENETETNVTTTASTYFTIIEDGDRRIIEKKDNTDYTITIADNSENGTIACAATTAKYGDKITITATPDFGYRLSRLVVKDALNNDVESTGNSFFMPKSNVTVSAVFEEGTHGTTEFAWGYFEPSGFVSEASIYDGLTTVNLQQGQSYQILKYDNERDYRKFLLDNSTYEATIPYSGGTGTFPEYGNSTKFNINSGESGFYDITMTDVGNGKWSVSILKTVGVIDNIPDQTYTGSAITPEPLVVAGSLSLTKGTDYTYSYENNTNVGTAKVTVTFKGNYALLGSVEKEFHICKTVSNPTIEVAAATYTGSALEPAVTVRDGDTEISSDEYTVSYTNNTNAGTATVTITDNAGGNYMVSGSTTFTINPKPVTITGLTASNKEYDGTVTATVTGTAVIDGKVDDDNVSVSAGTASFADANVGTGKTVTFSGWSLTGNDADNYTLSAQPASVTANITTCTITIKAADQSVEVGGTIATGTDKVSVTSGELVSGHSITAVTLTGDTSSITDNGTITISSVTIKDASDNNVTSNYDITYTAGTLTVTKKQITVSGITAKNKIYDGTTDAELDYSAVVLNGAASGAKLSVTATGAFANKNVGTGKTVTISGLTLAGDDAGNYVLAEVQQTTTTANITAKPVTITGLGASNKKYDGTTTATITGTAVISGLETGDSVSVSAGSASFADANVGTGKTITFSGYSLTGDDAGNYTLSAQPASMTANITPKSIIGATVTLSATQLEYSGTEQSVSVTSVKLGDTTLTTNDYDVSGNTGTNKNTYTVTVTGKGNYMDTATATWAITDKPMTVSASDVTVTYDGSAHGITVTVTAPTSGYTIKYGETEGSYTLDTSPTITNVSDSPKTVYYRVTADNYETYTGSATITINKASLTVTAKPKSITYGDAPANDGVEYSGFVNGETSAVLGGTLDFTYNYTQGGDVGSYTITPSGLTSDNYEISFVAGTLTVEQKEVTVNGITASNKEYNGTTDATLVYTGVKFNGETISGLTVTATGTFDDANVGTNKTVTISGLTLGGTDAGNYVLATSGQQTSTTANITKAAHDNESASGSAKYGKSGTVDLSALIVTGGSLGNLTVTDTGSIISGTPSVSGKTLTFAFADNADIVGKTATVTIPVTSTNYEDYTITATLTVSAKEAPVLTVQDITKTYDGTAVTAAAISGTAKVNGAAVAGAWSFVDGATFSNVADSGIKTVVFTPTNTADYETVTTTITVTINRKAVTVKADNKTRTIAEADPPFTATVTGLVGTDTVAYTLSRVAGEAVGTYTITPSGAAVQGNYTVTYQTGTLTITAATYLVTVNNGTGGGSYEAGASVTITANVPASNKKFKEWSGADGLTFTSGSKTTATATFTMPASAVTVTATYENMETVATPTFSPAAGSYTEAQSVTISCATSGATIYYTTNGTTPTTSSAIYSSAISVSATTTIKAIAVKAGMTNSAVASATYTISSVHVHSYTSVVTSEPTCTTTGLRTYTCSGCGDSYTEVIPALGHSYTSSVTTEPTCTTTGVRTYTCSRCGNSYTEVIPLAAHKYTTVRENEIAPDCIHAGSYDEVEKCSVCGDVKSRTTITTPALGHNFENGVCTRCGAVEVTSGNLQDVIDDTTDETVILALDSDADVSTLKFPKNVKEITIDGGGHTLDFTGAANIKPNQKLTLANITIKAEKNGKKQNITLTAAAGGLTLENVTFDGKKTTITATKGDLTLDNVTANNLTVKGAAKKTLTVEGNVSAATISGFGNIKAEGSLTITKTLKVNTLDLSEDAVLNVVKGAAITLSKGISGSGTINLASGFKAITINGKATGNINLTGDKMTDGQLIFKSKLTNLNDVFDVSGIAPEVTDGEYSYGLYSKSGKVYLRAFKMQVGDTTYCEWTDIMSGITKAKASGKSYTLTLLGDLDIAAALKLPTKGKYAGLTIDGNGHSISFKGTTLTLTGNLTLRNVKITAMKNGKPVAWTIKKNGFNLVTDDAELENCKIK